MHDDANFFRCTFQKRKNHAHVCVKKKFGAMHQKKFCQRINTAWGHFVFFFFGETKNGICGRGDCPHCHLCRRIAVAHASFAFQVGWSFLCTMKGVHFFFLAFFLEGAFSFVCFLTGGRGRHDQPAPKRLFQMPILWQPQPSVSLGLSNLHRKKNG